MSYNALISSQFIYPSYLLLHPAAATSRHCPGKESACPAGGRWSSATRQDSPRARLADSARCTTRRSRRLRPTLYLLPCRKSGKCLRLEHVLCPSQEVGVLPCVRGLRAGHRAASVRWHWHRSAVLPLLDSRRDHHRQRNPGCEGELWHCISGLTSIRRSQ